MGIYTIVFMVIGMVSICTLLYYRMDSSDVSYVEKKKYTSEDMLDISKTIDIDLLDLYLFLNLKVLINGYYIRYLSSGVSFNMCNLGEFDLKNNLDSISTSDDYKLVFTTEELSEEKYMITTGYGYTTGFICKKIGMINEDQWFILASEHISEDNNIESGCGEEVCIIIDKYLDNNAYEAITCEVKKMLN